MILGGQKRAVEQAWQKRCLDATTLEKVREQERGHSPSYLEPVIPLLIPFVAGVVLPYIAAPHRHALTLGSTVLSTTKLASKAWPIISNLIQRDKRAGT